MRGLVIILFIVVTSLGYSQTYNMTNGGSANTCSGNFYDNGGVSADYADNLNQTYTICSNNPAFKLEMFFSLFDVESFWDDLTVYDGNSTSAPVLGVFFGK